MQVSAFDPILYRVDREDRIVDVSLSWDEFARDNEGDHLDSRMVLGKKLWEYIKGASTAMLYQELLQEVRSHQLGVTFPFRCDSPGLRRFMTMTIQPEENGMIVFYSNTLRTEPRRPAVHAQEGLGNFPTIIRCSLCNRMRIRNQWLEVFDVVREGLALNHDLPVMVAHGVCTGCHQSVRDLRTFYSRTSES